jgi:hypothetical protein
VDWWQIVIILVGIGLISVIIGVFAGIPLSNILFRRREQVSIGKYQLPSKYKPITGQLDEVVKRYSELKTAVPDSEEIAERVSNEVETTDGQAETIAPDRLLLELEKNLELSMKPGLDKLESFQTDSWDALPDIPDIITAELKWELAEAYLDMHASNNIIWFLKEFGTESQELNDQYTKMCSQITVTLGKVIQILKTHREAET